MDMLTVHSVCSTLKRSIHILPLAGFLSTFILIVYFNDNYIRYFSDAGKESLHEPKPYEAFMYSSYYYNKSESLGDNAVALVFTASIDFNRLNKIQFIGWNETDNFVTYGKIERVTPHNVCRWITYTIRTTLLPNMTKLALVQGTKYHEIPFYAPRQKKREVVTCVAPLFANEQWQYAVFASHTYRRFGAHAHIYVRSMVSSVFELLREYEKEDYLTIQPWMRIMLSTVPESTFNPNINIEFRNQAAAQTDCLLQYKEAASFIAFMDLDDILIPRLGNTYFEEYSHLFNMIPNTAYIHYQKENVKVKGQRDASKFSVGQMYSSIYFNQKTETGKMVTRPSLINATWIHWPKSLPDNMDKYTVAPIQNVITHLKFLDDDTSPANPAVTNVPIYDPTSVTYNSTNTLLTKADIQWIQNDFARMWAKPAVRALMKSLPIDYFYFNIILKCYNDTFYKYHYGGRKKEMKCPGPDRCSWPKSPGIDCTNSIGEYFSSARDPDYNWHYTRNNRFRVEDGCRP